VAHIQPLDRTATDEGLSVPDRPERDLRLAQAVEIEGVLALQRRDGPHLLHVRFEERGNLRTGQVVHHDLHVPDLSSVPDAAVADIAPWQG
jgi:hypothetical protein